MSEAKNTPWAWRRFDDRLMLVTKHGGSRVILAAHDGVLETRCDGGWLMPLSEESDLAALLAAAPETAAERDKLREQNAAMLRALTMARECIAYCRKNHPDAQSGSGIPVEAFIDEALAAAKATQGVGA